MMKKLTNWFVKTVFLAVVAGFFLFNQPHALAQTQTSSAPVSISPVAMPVPMNVLAVTSVELI
jgi:hypothetical protein